MKECTKNNQSNNYKRTILTETDTNVEVEQNGKNIIKPMKDVQISLECSEVEMKDSSRINQCTHVPESTQTNKNKSMIIKTIVLFIDVMVQEIQKTLKT